MRCATALLALLAACYEPEARDCTLECEGADECADGQLCDADGFCATPAMAGMCNPNSSAGEPVEVSLEVAIDGDGKVNVDGVGTCDSKTSEGTCMFSVAPGVIRQLKAVENSDREFISWTSVCSGSTVTCTVTPVMSLTRVGAKFE
jgi:hypothetical protein